MTIDNMVTRILIAAIPVAVMLFIEIGLPLLRRRRERESEHPDEEGVPQGCSAAGAVLRTTSAEKVPRSPPISRIWRQDGRCYRILHRTAASGNVASMDKLGELALVRKDFVEAFYWKLMVDLHRGRPSGLSARGVCRAWQDAGCPEPNMDADGGGRLFTAKQAKLSMAVLDLWSGRHVRTPTATVRQMMEEGDGDARLYARRFGIGRSKS